jgi:hypothetical protein
MVCCCSTVCERKHLCANHIDSPIDESTDKITLVEDYWSFGSCSISSEGITNEDYWCGPMGDYKMFTPIKVELLEKQIATIKETIKELEKFNKE